jgi:hypothetical protein
MRVSLCGTVSLVARFGFGSVADWVGVVVFAVGASMLVDKVGRRKLFLTSNVGMVSWNPRSLLILLTRLPSSLDSQCSPPARGYTKTQAEHAQDTASSRRCFSTRLPTRWPIRLVRPCVVGVRVCADV